jgi:thioredoxin 1
MVRPVQADRPCARGNQVNIDENPDAPTTYGVRGIPTMILFKGGEKVAEKVGAAPKSQLKGWLESVL